MQVKITLFSFDPSYEAVATVHSMEGTHLMSCRFVFAHEPEEGLPESGEYLHKISIVPHVDGATLPFYAQARAVAEAADFIDDCLNSTEDSDDPFEKVVEI